MTRGWFPADRLDAELVANDASKPDDDRMVAFEYLSRLNRQEELARQLKADLRQRERDLAEDARRNRPVDLRFDARVEFEFGGSARRRFREGGPVRATHYVGEDHVIGNVPDLTLTQAQTIIDRATAYEIAHPDPILKQARAIKEQRKRDQAALDEAWAWSHEAGIERFEPLGVPTRPPWYACRSPHQIAVIISKMLMGFCLGWFTGMLMGLDIPLGVAINTALCFGLVPTHLRLRHMIARMVAITIVTTMIMLSVLAFT